MTEQQQKHITQGGFVYGQTANEEKRERCRFSPLGQEDPLEKGMAAHSSILAWRIPWTDRSLAGYSPSGSQRLGHDWSDLACTHLWSL